MAPKSGKPVNWRTIAAHLAERLSNHAFCVDHSEQKPDPDCPWCEDRAAYLAYLEAGGFDHRPEPTPESETISLWELRQQHERTGPAPADPDAEGPQPRCG